MNVQRLIYIAVAVLGGGFLLYYFYTRMNTKKEKNVGGAAIEEAVKSTATLSPVVAELPPSPAAELPQIPPTPVKGFGFGTSTGSTFGGGIASRMANLSIPKRT
jgi:hypothetical protein